jgi:hypothetical protein
MRKTTTSFISKAKSIHGGKYNYDKVVYEKATSKVIINCLIHGDFMQTPNSHTNGSGCPKCGRDKVEGSRRKTSKEFIADSIKIHGNKYDYSKTEYKGWLEYVTIICPKHGEFKQTARKHIEGNNCKKCANDSIMMPEQDFIDRVSELHDNYYDYTKTKYKGIFSNIIITCPFHGDFELVATNHLHKSRGCKKCVNKTKSKAEQIWLDFLKIKERNIYLTIGDKTFCVDGLDRETNTIYEFYGDFFHGNPLVYDPNKLNPLLKVTFGQLYEETMAKENIIKSNGYNLIAIWENEFKKLKI